VTKNSDALLEQLRELSPHGVDLSLSRMHALLGVLDHPEKRLAPVIHVAGTNGKGSIIAFMKAMLEASGARVHVYTSPYLSTLHESIKVAGAGGTARDICEPALVDVLSRVVAAARKTPATLFEAETAAALLAFAETPADFVLMETGLGGRLDATNVIDRPTLCVLTPIAHDHGEFLGDRIADIAAEKAGILKAGTPAVVAPQSDVALEVIRRRAGELGINLSEAGQEWLAHEEHGRLVYQSDDGLMDLPLPVLMGRHQIANAGTAIAAVRHLGQAAPNEKAIAKGLLEARWQARLQRLGEGALFDHAGTETEIWVDGGHNPSAAHALAHSVAELEERASRPLHLVVGMLVTKDAAGFLEPFAGLVEAVFAVPVPKGESAFAPSIPSDELADVARNTGIWAEACATLQEALEKCRQRASAPPRILICGSLYLAAYSLKCHERLPTGR